MNKELNELRKEINETDKKLLDLLKKRFETSIKIGKYKLDNGLAIEDKKREEEIIDSRANSGKLNKDFTKRLFELIFKESKRIQKEIK